MQYRVPCRHYTEPVTINTQVTDHYPLTRLQVETLLEAAMTADTLTLDSILDRLAQGIPGMTCPQPGREENLTGKKLGWLERYFWEQKRRWTEPEVVAAIAALMSE